jgi:hypothetical protein
MFVRRHVSKHLLTARGRGGRGGGGGVSEWRSSAGSSLSRWLSSLSHSPTPSLPHSHSQLPPEMDTYFSRTKQQYSQLSERLMGDMASSELAAAAKQLSDIGKTVELIEQREQLLRAIEELEKMAREELEK